MSRKHLTAFKHLVTAVAMMGFALSSAAAMTDIAALEKEAKGQTVYFNAWGGDEKINAYISWAGQQMKERYDVSVDHVKLTDTAAAVSRILAEKTAGRADDGSVDLLWVNGENFAAMKRAGLLQDHDWVTSLPNWALTDATELPALALDFAVPTDGRESPWGRAQLVFFYDSAYLQAPPHDAASLKDYTLSHPGPFT